MRFYLIDLPSIEAHLWPFSLSRSAADIPVGMFNLRQKWDLLVPKCIQGHIPTAESAWHFSDQPIELPPFPLLAIASHCLPSQGLLDEVKRLLPGQSLWQGNAFLAVYAQNQEELNLAFQGQALHNAIQATEKVELLDRIWKIQEWIGREIARDLSHLPASSHILEQHWGNILIGPPERLHVAEGARIVASVINTTQGDVYLDADSEVMEGCMIRGPFYLGKHSTLKMGTRIYGPVAAGMHVKLGGEISQSQIFDYSNKGHEGYLGNSVIGSWCNLGADTNNSNLKNNYAEVKLWNQALQTFENTGLQFCGLFMGDHSKTGINTMFNTGTVVGFSCNIFGSGFPRNLVPSFRWGGASGVIPYKLEAAKETANAMMARRKIEFNAQQESLFQRIFARELVVPKD